MSETAETDNASTQRTPRKKAATRKAAAKSASKDSRTHRANGSGSVVSGARLAYLGAEQLVELTRKPFEGVIGLARTDDGWTVEVEVLEMRRIPETTDVIGVYEVCVDSSGELESYRRTHRYLRGEAGEKR